MTGKLTSGWSSVLITGIKAASIAQRNLDTNIALPQVPKDNFDSSLHGEPEDLLCAQHISQSATGNLGEAITQNVSIF